MKLLAISLGVLWLALLVSVGPGAQDVAPAPSAPITIFLLRHAEPDPAAPDARDPGLSEAGRERARSLARLLESSGASVLVSTEYARTRETLTPLAEASTLAIETAPAADVPALAARLRALEPGTVAVVAGHSNTVPALALALGAPPLAGTERHPQHGAVLPHAEHDRIVELVLPGCAGAPVRALELRYGE